MYTELGVPGIDENELQVARDFRATLTEADKQMKKYPELANKELADLLLPYRPAATMAASTDVGDVSWIVPTAECYSACTALGTAFHSWQMVAQGTTSFAHKGMLHAGKVIAATAAEVMQHPEILAQAKDELKERLDGGVYVCPIPPDVQPAVLR
jgi:aminobenzoyl-glutamate utilization protein B